MSAKQAFMQAAEAAGIAVEYTPGGTDRRTGSASPFHVMLDAPAGKLFCASGCHCDGSIQGDEGSTRTDWREAYRGLQAILALGFDDCTDPDCDVCNP